MNKGIVFDIQRASFHDGPGLRTTVFLKGCFLHCAWCQNPESINPEPEVFTNPNTLESRLVGSLMTVQEVMDIIIKDKSYYDSSGGGLTISGGEPLFQSDFVYELVKEAKSHQINVAIETSGSGQKEDYIELSPYVDYFLIDYKMSNHKKLEELTGGRLDKIEENVEMLYKLGNKIIRRCLIIFGVNDTKEHLDNIARMTVQFPKLHYTELLLYNNYGMTKATSINREYNFQVIENQTTPHYKNRLIEQMKKRVYKNIYVQGEKI